MSKPIIEVRNLTKRYRLGSIGATSLREEFSRYWDRLRGVPHPDAQEFWALRDVSFDVQPGEVVGIIGRNGAGKSTLLKILSRITEPTSGTAKLRGRVASLLEVGTGFHPELTGRENVFLNGAILGMSRAEIRGKFDEIVAFAEVDQFIDTPVKRYSSGMYVRLAFAVAAHLEPEILIVDEVLAVGDAAFQRKCVGKIGEVAHQHGRTVLFVSHNIVAVQSLCRRAVLLESGCVAEDDIAGIAVSRYLKGMRSDVDACEWSTPETAPGSEVLRLKRVAVISTAHVLGAHLTMQEPFMVDIDFWALLSRRKAHLTLHLLNDQGIIVLTTGSNPQMYAQGLHRATCHFPANLLNSGDYTLKLLIVENGNHVTYANEAVAFFSIADNSLRDEAWFGREPGVVQPRLEWHVIPAGIKDGVTIQTA